MVHMLRISLLSAACITLAAASAIAGPITWQTPQSETGDVSDILTTGTFVESGTVGPTVMANGVTFDTGSHPYGVVAPWTFAGGNITLGPYSLGGYDEPQIAPATWDPNYVTLAEGETGAYYVPYSLAIGGLTPGQDYTLQIFEGFNYNYDCATFSDGTNTSAPVCSSGGSGIPQYVIGTFTAGSTLETLTVGDQYDFSAIQVRTSSLPAPEPGTLALLLVGTAGIFTLRIRRTRLL